jgi:predicted ATP-grasp superfamily ATP-dependent carboligase
MDKRANLRQHFQTEANIASTDKQYQQRTAQLKDFENTLIVAMNTLIKFLDGKTTKTEVVNQLKSISTPDVDKVVQAVSKLDKDILTNKLDLKPVTDGLNSLKRELSLIPKTLPKIPEAKDIVRVSNLSEVRLDTSAVEKAIKGLKLDVKAPIINTEKTDITPLKDVMLDLLKVIKNQKPVEVPKFPEIPKTDLTKVETKLDESNKHLKKLVDKPVGGGGGGGGNGTPYVDSTGKPLNVELETDGSVPVTVVAGGSAGTANLNTRVDKATTDIIYIGKAALGTATSAASWQIKKIDKTVTDNVTITFAAAGAFTATWDNRGSETYS